MADSLASQLASLFDAERTARRLHARLVQEHTRSGADSAPLVEALRKELEEARAQKDAEEQALRMVRIAVLLGDLQGGPVVDLLIELLGSDEPEARHAAGEALEGLAYDRFKEVALGIERALGKLPVGSPALSELPYMIAEIPEPGAAKLLGLFLKHEDPEAVAAAIEALVEVGDPAAASMLAPLAKDTRVVQLEDDEGEEGKVTIGELAVEARELLSDIEDGARGAGRSTPGTGAPPGSRSRT
jgi:HEAT repeat protein